MNYQCDKCFKIFSKIGECEDCQESHVTQEQENPEQYYRRPSMYEYRRRRFTLPETSGLLKTLMQHINKSTFGVENTHSIKY